MIRTIAANRTFMHFL